MLLNEGVRVLAGVPLRAFLLIFDRGAHLSGVEVAVPSTVLGVVVVDAVLVVVVLGYVAGVDLEELEVEMLSQYFSTFITRAVLNW